MACSRKATLRRRRRSCVVEHIAAGYVPVMTENPMPTDPDQRDDVEQDPDDEQDQDAGPTTMAPPGEGADSEGQVG